MSERIRVLLAIGSMAGGGSERQIVGLLRHLDRSKFDPMLYLVYRSGELLPEVPSDIPIFAFWDDYRMPRINYPGRIHANQVRHLRTILRLQAVQVLYDRTLLMSLIAGPAAVRERVPRVSVVVADPKPDFAHQAGPFRWIKWRLLRAAYRNSAMVVALSDDLKRSVIDSYGLPPTRVVVSRNGIDLKRVDALAQDGDPAFGPDRFHMVSAGRLQEQKGFKYLIEAMDLLVHQRGQTQLLLHILGQGPLQAKLREMVNRRGLQSFVQFHGFQTNPLCYYRNAHLVCLASLYEGTPNVLLEAMACRVPVVATDCVSGPREVLQGGKHGRLVAPADSIAMADAIEEAINEYDTYLRRVNPARQWLENHFSMEAAARRTEDLLLRVCQESATG